MRKEIKISLELSNSFLTPEQFDLRLMETDGQVTKRLLKIISIDMLRNKSLNDILFEELKNEFNKEVEEHL